MLHDQIMNRNFYKVFKNIIICAAILLLITVAGFSMAFHVQIGEMYSFLQNPNQQISVDNTTDLSRSEANVSDMHSDKLEHNIWQQHDDEHEYELEMLLSEITPPSVISLVFMSMLLILWLLLIIYYWICVVEWLYKSSVNSGMNRALWPILGVFFNLLAVCAFLIVRESPKHQAG